MIADRIKRVIQDSGLSLPQFSSRTGIKKSTLVNYRDGLYPPTTAFLQRVCEEFLVNPEWLLLGKGTMKVEQSLTDMSMPLSAVYGPDDPRGKMAAQQQPPGRKAASQTNQDQGEVMLESPELDLNREPSTEPQGFKIHEDIQIAIKVLESGTAYAVALHLNIQQFGKAVDEQTGMAKLRHTVNAQAGTINDLQQECHAMRKEVEELKLQLARLLSTGEDNPGPSQEVA